MTDRMTIQCWEPVQAHKAMTEQLWPQLKSLLMAGHKMVIELRPKSKSRDQEQKYHAMIGEIAEQAKHLGATWDAESWKRLLVNKFCKEIGVSGGHIIPNLDGDGIVQLDFQTRKFTIDQASQFVEFLLAWGVNNGIVFKQ